MARDPRPVGIPKGMASKYEEELRRGLVDPTIRSLKENMRLDSGNKEALNAILYSGLEGLDLEQMYASGTSAAKRHMRSVAEWHKTRLRRTFQAVGADLDFAMSEEAVRAAMQRRLADNARLIRTIPSRMHESLVAQMQNLQRSGKRFDPRTMERLLRNEYASAGYNVRRLTRDQTTKQIGQLTQLRHTQAGFTHYRWLTSGDQRVRGDHQALNGKVIAWAEPPSVGHPGNAIMCRCQAQAVIPETSRLRPGAPSPTDAPRYDVPGPVEFASRNEWKTKGQKGLYKRWGYEKKRRDAYREIKKWASLNRPYKFQNRGKSGAWDEASKLLDDIKEGRIADREMLLARIRELRRGEPGRVPGVNIPNGQSARAGAEVERAILRIADLADGDVTDEVVKYWQSGGGNVDVHVTYSTTFGGRAIPVSGQQRAGIRINRSVWEKQGYSGGEEWPQSVSLHEVGHHFEFALEGLVRDSNDWLGWTVGHHRGKPVFFSEMDKGTRFYHYEVFGESIYSEVVSNGLQHMAMDPLELAKQNPDLFVFIYVNVLRRSIG